MLRLLEPEWLRFAPSGIRTDAKRQRRTPLTKGRLKGLADEDFSRLSIQGGDGQSFEFTPVSTWRFEALYWKIDERSALSQDRLLELYDRPGFTAGYIADADDVFWQSMENLSTFELMGRDSTRFPKRRRERTGELVIDTSNNYGRRELFVGFWLQAAWRMAFGGVAFEYLPRQRLLSFAQAEKVTEHANGVVEILLYEQPSSPNALDKRRRQKAFWNWMDFDGLIAGRHSILERDKDPSVEVTEGALPHGGVRQLTQWFDESGAVQRRSKAAYRVTTELDEYGNVLWREQAKP